MAETTLPLFVYGTLRRASAHPLARRLWASGRDLGGAKVRGRLLDLGAYPAWLPPAGDGDWVEGDLVLPALPWRVLDGYEGDEYERRQVEAVTSEGARVAWIYARRAGAGDAR